MEDSDTVSGAIKVDPKAWAIDFTWEDGPTKGKTVKSIYNIHRDVLLLCMSDAGKDRPTVFSSEKGGEWTLIKLKRVKK